MHSKPFIHWLKFSRDRGHEQVRRPLRFLPHVTMLEDRTVPSTFVVRNTHDSGVDSLRAAIAAANANPGADTITFAAGVHGTITLTSGELLINDSVTINGPGASRLAVSGNNSTRIFDIVPGLAVTISSLTITRGYALEQGGGIFNQGSDLMLSADTLSNNVAFGSASTGARGGAVRNLAGNLAVVDCTFSGNQAQGGNAALGDALAGGISMPSGNLTISNSTFIGNTAQGADNSLDGEGYGGAISVGSVATITASTFSGNRAIGGNGGTGPFLGDAGGGAINCTQATTTISGCAFDHNVAIAGSGGNSGPATDDPFMDYSFGGAINAEYFSLLTITGTGFSHNQAIGGSNGTAVGLDIIGVGGAEGGAVINEVGAVASLTACWFDHNAAIGGNGNSGSGPVVLVGEGLGGAIVSGYGGSDLGPNTLTVNSCIFTHNRAQGGNNNSGTVSISGLVGTGAGAAIANYAGGIATISGSLFDHNLAVGGNGNSGGGLGAVLAGSGAAAGVFNYLSNYNSPPYDFGAIGVSTASVTGSILTANQAIGGTGGAGFGGGAYNDAASTLALSYTLVLGNAAIGSPGSGGGIYNLGAFTYDISTLIAGNHASTSGDNIGP